MVLKIDIRFNPLSDVFYDVRVIDGDLDGVVGAIGDATAASTAVVVVDGPAVDDGYGPEAAGIKADTATHAVVGHFDADTFYRRDDAVQVFPGDVLE